MIERNERGLNPFQWGDRIDHPKFGLGTVNGEPIAVVGAGPPPRYGIEDRGWRVPVEWDDPYRKTGSVNSEFIRLVDRPNAKGGAYWNHEFQGRLDRVIAARAETNGFMKTAFRPLKGSQVEVIKAKVAAEQELLAELLQFLVVDDTGDHA